MIQFTIIDALNKLLPNVEWNIIDNDLSTLEIFTAEIASPTKKQIDDAIKALENEHKLAQEQKATEKAALLAKLGITDDEAKLLLS
jgi:hypothetical protein